MASAILPRLSGGVVAEPSESVLDSVRTNPLYHDTILFELYMTALDVVLANHEIRAASDEFGISPHHLRMTMVLSARGVLGAAPREFAAYQKSRDFESAAVDGSSGGAGRSGDPAAAEPRPAEDLIRVLRAWCLGCGFAGAVMTAVAIAGGLVSVWAGPLRWAGVTTLAVAGLSYAALRMLRTGIGLRLLKGELIPTISHPHLVAARFRLMAAISETELLAQARTFANKARQDRLSHEYSVAGSPGLAEASDFSYQVPTDIAGELDGLLGRLDGASIGVAGPRGAGKSTLIRGYCDEAGPAQTARARNGRNRPRRPGPGGQADGNLRCVVAAPVDYVARDFVLHLFAVFCRAVVRRYSRTTHRAWGVFRAAFLRPETWRIVDLEIWPAVIFAGGAAAILLRWQDAIADRVSVPAAGVRYAAIAVIVAGGLSVAWPFTQIGRLARTGGGAVDKTFVAAARRHLARVRYLQTHTTGWSGSLRLPGGSEGQHSRGLSRAEQPLSYPEIVQDFRQFAREVAAHTHGDGHRVFVGVDEIDKIGSPEQAERFLNEIKGIFGIPHLYFMVSVSDDALTAFERRGLPLRDAFDSSFDEIIHVGPLGYAESRRLLYRRVIGLTEPYVALCHCLAGGLARDLIRAARQVVRAAAALTATGPSPPPPDQVEASTAYLLLRDEPASRPLLPAISAAIVRDELRRKVRAVAHVTSNIAPGQGQQLQNTLHDVARHLAPAEPAIKIVDIVGKPARNEPPGVTSVRLDFAGYAYYCATLQEIFTEKLDSARMIEATRASPEAGTFDAMAAARFAFTIDTQLAWNSITQCRQAWQLETRQPIM